MSKTGRGLLRGPGPYFCLYSPECVEGEFSEVRLARVGSGPSSKRGPVRKVTPSSGAH
jgi:hypothetical protein